MTKRNYGIELLRILSMTMIVILHTLRWGGIMDHIAPGSLGEHLGYILETATFCCVNCFAMISGYVMCHSKNRFSRLLLLWLQVMFYSLGFLAVACLVFPEWIHFGALASLHPVLMVLAAVGCGMAIFLVCSSVDNLRQGIFRILRIPVLCQKAENLVTKAADKLLREKEKV